MHTVETKLEQETWEKHMDWSGMISTYHQVTSFYGMPHMHMYTKLSHVILNKPILFIPFILLP